MLLFVNFIFLSHAYSTQFVPTSGNPPQIRQLLRITIDQIRNLLYLYGGSTEGGVYLDDLWRYNLTAASWQHIVPHSLTKPRARISCGFFVDSKANALYVFGGEAKVGYLNDLWRFDIGQLRWTELQTKGEVPPPFAKFGHTAYTDSYGKLMFSVCNGKSLYRSEKDVYR
mmetsp:Transcript_4480/g.8650  ORF Transcript_4480/g.8650 Transcript_4480/m.8650 type:complete len:170 (-) Transcript_4480:143-652(-)